MAKKTEKTWSDEVAALICFVKYASEQHDIPIILVGRDDEKDKGFCLVEDDADNVSMLMEAIAHCEALRKAVLEAFAKILAASPSLETKLMAAVGKFRNQNKREKV